MTAFWKKAAEAAMWTFIEVFLVTIAPAIAVAPDLSWSSLQGGAASAGLAALGAAASLVKSMVVRNIGAEDSPFITG